MIKEIVEMDANILCTLLAQQIPPEQFQLWGTEIHWMDEQHNTPENMAIVTDVIANYDTLATAYLAEREKTQNNEKVKAALAEIDLKTVRSMREWIAKQPDVPQFAKDYEAQAEVERGKLK